jgi:predicted patatin/cPLA2 family phospholipase
MKTIYFPPCGYAFWYIFGKYKSIENIKEYELVGSSSGTMICLISLLKPKYQTYSVMMELSTKIHLNQTFPLNLHKIYIEFFDGLLDYIDVDNLEENLKRIKVQVTRVKAVAYIIPTLQREIISPSNMTEFRELCIASSYIPFLSRIYPLFFCYSVKGKYYIDGGFADIFQPIGYYEVTFFEADKYSSKLAPTECECREMYIAGLNNEYI